MLIWLTYASLWLAMGCYYLNLRSQSIRWGWLGSAALITCLILLTPVLVMIAMEGGHWPISNRYEFALCLVWMSTGIYLLLETSWGDRRAGAFVTVVILITATYAITRTPTEKEVTRLLPALRSPWLQIHALSSLIAYSAMGIAAGLGTMQILSPAPVAESNPEHDLKTTREIENTMERVIALGFPWLTLGILAGAIWAQIAWGRYWGWDPKEIWALVTWLWYMLVLHIRALRNWRGKRLAWLVIAGYCLVLFTYVGVPWLVRTVRLESLHGF